MEDTPYHRKTIAEMSQQEQEQWLTEVRMRRMKVKLELEEAARVREVLKSEKAKEDLDKQLKMLEKDVATLDKAAERIEKRMAKVWELRLIAERSS